MNLLIFGGPSKKSTTDLSPKFCCICQVCDQSLICRHLQCFEARESMSSLNICNSLWKNLDQTLPWHHQLILLLMVLHWQFGSESWCASGLQTWPFTILYMHDIIVDIEVQMKSYVDVKKSQDIFFTNKYISLIFGDTFINFNFHSWLECPSKWRGWYCHSLNSTSNQVESDKVISWTTTPPNPDDLNF